MQKSNQFYLIKDKTNKTKTEVFEDIFMHRLLAQNQCKINDNYKPMVLIYCGPN